jgi:hypothetical protein
LKASAEGFQPLYLKLKSATSVCRRYQNEKKKGDGKTMMGLKLAKCSFKKRE